MDMVGYTEIIGRIAAGGGLGGIVGYMLALAAQRSWRDEDDGHTRRRISVVMGENAVGVAAMVDVLDEVGATVTEIDCRRHLGAETPVFVTLGVRCPDRLPIAALIAGIESQPGVRRVHVHPAA